MFVSVRAIEAVVQAGNIVQKEVKVETCPSNMRLIHMQNSAAANS